MCTKLLAFVAAAATARSVRADACTNVNNTDLTGDCQDSNGNMIIFDLSCIQPAAGQYFGGELHDDDDQSDYFYYMSFFGLPTSRYGQCKLPDDLTAGNTVTQAAKDGSACYVLGMQDTGTWAYQDVIGGSSLQIQYTNSRDSKSVQINIICDETAETPIFTPTGEDPNQPNDYNLEINSKWVCRDFAGTKKCPRNKPQTGRAGGGGTVFIAVVIGMSAAYFGGGYMFLRFVKKVDGDNQIPQHHFWSTLPGLVKDGVRFSRSLLPCPGLKGECGTYQSV